MAEAAERRSTGSAAANGNVLVVIRVTDAKHGVVQTLERCGWRALALDKTYERLGILRGIAVACVKGAECCEAPSETIVTQMRWADTRSAEDCEQNTGKGRVGAHPW